MAGMLEFKTPVVNMLRAIVVRALPLDVGYLLTTVPMPHSCSSTYPLAGVSLTLDMGYLLIAAPVKCSHSSQRWTWGISSRPHHRSIATTLCGPTCCYEPCRVGSPMTDQSWWRVLTKCGPLEKGMANHFSILALRTP